MSKIRHRLLPVVLLTLASFGVNFLIFIYNYNKLATPYITEEQRVDNTGFIMSSTLGLYVIAALLIGAAFYLVLNKNT